MIFTLRSMILIFVLGMIVCGCSGNSSHPVSPENPESSTGMLVTEGSDVNSPGSDHYLMYSGYIYVDPNHPDGPRIEVIPARQGEVHLNILKLLEIAPCDDCFRVVDFDFPEPDKLNVDIQIDHPMTGLEYSVFDVSCIIMFNGNREFPSSGITISDPSLGDGAVLNPDGYTALYNGSTLESPAGDYQKYFQGELATYLVPDADISGYKYFTSENPLNDRNAFYAGASDTQTFSLQLPASTFVLGYAVDANWSIPITSPVEDPLTDFDMNANCTEPWKIEVQDIGPGLNYEGGTTKLQIDVYDWQGKSTHHAPDVECPDLFTGIQSAIWVSDGDGYARYEATISNTNLAPQGNYSCLIGIEANENDPLGTPWLDLTAYQVIGLNVSGTGYWDGNLMWAKRAGGASGSDNGYGITTLSDNSTVVTGYFRNTATFGLGEPNETVLTSAGYTDIFIACFNPGGTLAWAKRAGGAGSDRGYGITTLSDNSTVVTGHFGESATFGPGELNETVLTSAGWCDMFIARFEL